MEENLRNLLSDNAEVLIDSLIDNEVLKEIPILGTSINAVKAYRNIRDNAYLNKVKTFIDKIGQINESQRKRLIEESKKDEKRRAKFGESLFTTIEQSESLTKIEYLAVVFEAFLNLEINDEDLRYICFGIKNSYIDDLIKIVESENIPSQMVLKYNTASGFAVSEFRALTLDMTDTEPEYKITAIGEKLRQCWKKYK